MTTLFDPAIFDVAIFDVGAAAAEVSIGLAAQMRITSVPVGMTVVSVPIAAMRITSVSDVPVIRRAA